MTIPTIEDFRSVLRQQMREAELSGESSTEINGGELHRQVGGYPGPNHRMRTCCEALTSEMRSGDRIVQSPPKGYGASLTVRYTLPR
jgi:hypothetical protein